MTNELQVNETVPMTISEMKSQFNLILEAQKQVMVDGEDYGVIQGTKKPTLLKAGAEKLNLLFRLDPQYEIQETYEPTPEGPKHYTVVSKCTLYHSPTGRRLGSGYGSCSTKEKKYAYRDAQRKCPKCGQETIIKGKDEYGGGWLCFAKKGGCGAKFKDDDETITSQVMGQVMNPDLADLYNTILKMANKRSLVAATLNVTAASAIFTQDLEDMTPSEAEKKTEMRNPATKPAEKAPTEKTPVADPNYVFDLPKIKLGMDKCASFAELNAIMKSMPEKYRNGEVMEYYGVKTKELKEKGKSHE